VKILSGPATVTGSLRQQATALSHFRIRPEREGGKAPAARIRSQETCPYGTCGDLRGKGASTMVRSRHPPVWDA